MRYTDPHRRGKSKCYLVIHQGELKGTIIRPSKKQAMALAKKKFTPPVRLIRTDCGGHRLRPALRRHR